MKLAEFHHMNFIAYFILLQNIYFLLWWQYQFLTADNFSS